jgi:hypothetical protein
MQKQGFLLTAVVCALGCTQSPGTSESVDHSELADHDDHGHQSAHSHWTHADDALIAPVWTGDDDHGSLYTPLWRGANSAIEDYVYAPPNQDCSQVKGTALFQWDSSANTVHITLKYRGMPVSPVVTREENVTWFANPFHQAPKDLTQSAYKFWIIFNSFQTPTFYYDASTLLLKGSQFDFPSGPPPGTIPIPIPDYMLTASSLMHPDPDGYMFHEYTIPYDSMTAEGGGRTVARVTFIPFDLCESIPGQPGLGQARPYAIWQSAPGPSFKQALQSGLTLDTSIDDDSVHYPDGQLPYVYSNIAFVSNTPAINGGMPNGTYFSLPASIENVQPLVTISPGGGSVNGCTPFLGTPHVTAPRFCEMH